LYETLTGRHYPIVNVIGAACKNPYWLQLKANILNREIVACNVDEAVSKGRQCCGKSRRSGYG
jgi:sugar (pentulose or hexulose) kinase